MFSLKFLVAISFGKSFSSLPEQNLPEYYFEFDLVLDLLFWQVNKK